MNLEFANRLLKRIGNIQPANCESDFVEHPFPPCRKSRCVEIGFVVEHRFAFYYWIQCKQNMLKKGRGRDLKDDGSFHPPDLVTWDWHDDVGGVGDFIEAELVELNQADPQEVGLFCWAGLHQLNDGHIAPAMWLNCIGNVYVIQKQRTNCKQLSRTITDRFGNDHEIFYFRSLVDFARDFVRTSTSSGVIWDLDMDFFMKETRYDSPSSVSISDIEIREMLSPDTPWLPLILGDLHAITIALEPNFTGSLSKSLELFKSWESALFSKPIFSKTCKWQKGILK